ncbi:hypothetical protein PybrP1_011266 [[Pythium] brassicae (nom. inval.)]|nr:hypothetical protein PybrP1_011266 [[Pythium] brassicae (nom. inval.)]
MARAATPSPAAAQLTPMEILVPSAVTSALVAAVAVLRSAQVATTPAVSLMFFALLPALLALALVQEHRMLQPYKRAFMALFRCGDPLADEDAALTATAHALATARAELHRALADRWPARRGVNAAAASSPALALALQPPQSRGPRLRRREAGSSSSAASSSEIPLGAGSGSGGKSLYDQVKEKLEDHAFRTAADAPIYFMDATTGLFLRVNAQHKLVFTSAPDASCLFHVARGKTHHWGFLSAIYQRFVGQNFVGRVVVSAKKLQGWESFRVLQRPDGADGDARGSDGDAACSPTVYMILCSSRFGKGMWLAKNHRSSTAPLSSSGLGPSRTASSSSVVTASGDEPARDNIYLSKTFANALALTYASDLSAFEYLANDRAGAGAGVGNGPRAAPSGSPLPVAMGTTFQTPVLVEAERAHMALPWIADPSVRRFFELPDRQLTEVISTTVTRCTTHEFVEMLYSEEARRFASDRAAALASGSSNKPLSEWHAHPHFGFVRKRSYRPAATPESDADSSSSSVSASGSAGRKAVAIDQYHSYVLGDKATDKVTFRSKLYTLSTPFSNCFSIETVFELQNLPVDASTGGGSPVMQFRCRTGVHFTRPTMFAALIEKGALQGVKNVCDLLLETAKERRGRAAAPVAASATTAATAAQAGSSSTNSNPSPPPPSVIPPHTLAMEVVKGMIVAYQGAKSLHSSFKVLPTRLPWTVHSGEQRAGRAELSSGAAAPVVVAPTKTPFFESAPLAFKLVLEEGLGGKVSPRLFFDSLLSDESSFLYAAPRESGNMEVDVCAWRPFAVAPAATAADDSESDSDAGCGFVRLQTFRMPLDGLPGVEIADVSDFQYYAFVHDERAGKNRLEFGSKLVVRDLPEGEHYSIETLVHVEMNDGAPSSVLRVYFAIPDSRARGVGDREPPSTSFATVEIGVHQGLRAIWKEVALTMLDASQPTSHLSFFQSYQELGSERIQQRLQSEGRLPTHDELASRLIAAVASAF